MIISISVKKDIHFVVTVQLWTSHCCCHCYFRMLCTLTGQGGHNLTSDKHQFRDQKLERGNLALKVCLFYDFSIPLNFVDNFLFLLDNINWWLILLSVLFNDENYGQIMCCMWNCLFFFQLCAAWCALTWNCLNDIQNKKR